MEQRVTANDVRSKQAHEAAETGMQDAMSFFSNGIGGVAFDGTNTETVFYNNVLTSCANGITDTDAAYVQYCVIDGDGLGWSEVTIAGSKPYVVTSVGFSDDGLSTHTIFQMIDNANPLENPPTNPLTARGTVAVGGSATIYNLEGATTIWSGNAIDLTANAASATFVADPESVGYPGCMDSAMTCTGTQSSNMTTNGLDAIEFDENLSNLTAYGLFHNFFKKYPLDYYKASSKIFTEAQVEADASVLANLTGEVIWVGPVPNAIEDVDGDDSDDGTYEYGDSNDIDGSSSTNPDISFGGETVGCSVDVNGVNAGNDALPNDTCPDIEPSILIINGNLDLTQGMSFYGVVFVMGNLTGTGNTVSEGAMVIAGGLDNSFSGSIDIWYNSSLLSATQYIGGFSGLSGTWHDWD